MSLPSGQPEVADFWGGVPLTKSPFLLHCPKKVKGPASGLLVVFVVSDIDADHQRLVDGGVEITTPLQTEPWGRAISPGDRPKWDRDPARAVGHESGRQPGLTSRGPIAVRLIEFRPFRRSRLRCAARAAFV